MLFSVKTAHAFGTQQQCRLMAVTDFFPCRTVNILKCTKKILERLGLLFLQRLDHLPQSFFCQAALLVVHLQARIFLSHDSLHGSRPFFLHLQRDRHRRQRF